MVSVFFENAVIGVRWTEFKSGQENPKSSCVGVELESLFCLDCFAIK